MKGITNIILKSTRIIVKLFYVLSRDENTEKMLNYIVSLLETINDFIKKQNPDFISKTTRHLKTLLKFALVNIKLKSCKSGKLKLLINEAENNLNKKTIEVSTLNKLEIFFEFCNEIYEFK